VRLALRNASHILNMATWPSISGSTRHPSRGGKSPVVHQTPARAGLPPRQNHIHDPPKTLIMVARPSAKALTRRHRDLRRKPRAFGPGRNAPPPRGGGGFRPPCTPAYSGKDRAARRVCPVPSATA